MQFIWIDCCKWWDIEVSPGTFLFHEDIQLIQHVNSNDHFPPFAAVIKQMAIYVCSYFPTLLCLTDWFCVSLH